MQNQMILFLAYDQHCDWSIIRTYKKIFNRLDRSFLPGFNRDIGAKTINPAKNSAS
jgi:hypothetical protein